MLILNFNIQYIVPCAKVIGLIIFERENTSNKLKYLKSGFDK